MSDYDDGRPRDVDAERAVLGAMLLGSDRSDPHPVAVVTATLERRDFSVENHGELFAVIAEMWEHGRPTDPIAVAALLGDRNLLLRMGGAPYLHTLTAATPTTANAGYYADIVADRAARARLVDAADAIRQVAMFSSDVTSDVQARALDAMEAATASRAVAEDDGGWLSELADDYLDAWDDNGTLGVAAPIRALNDALGGGRGLLPGQFAIVAARPGVGKSVLLTDWCLAAARRGEASVLATMEMNRNEVMDRFVAATCKLRLEDVQSRNLRGEDRAKAQAAVREIAQLPVKIVDRSALTTARLRAIARQASRSNDGLALLAVDYVQLLTPADPKLGQRESYDGFSRDLKVLAGELGVPVLAAAQLNREAEGRPDKVPRLSELKGSGSFEQDANVVMLLHRPDYYDHTDRAGQCDVHIAKNRNGPTTTVTVDHQLQYARFRGAHPDSLYAVA